MESRWSLLRLAPERYALLSTQKAQLGMVFARALKDRALGPLEDALELGTDWVSLEWALSEWPHERITPEAYAIYGLVPFGKGFRGVPADWVPRVSQALSDANPRVVRARLQKVIHGMEVAQIQPPPPDLEQLYDRFTQLQAFWVKAQELGQAVLFDNAQSEGDTRDHRASLEGLELKVQQAMPPPPPPAPSAPTNVIPFRRPVLQPTF